MISYDGKTATIKGDRIKLLSELTALMRFMLEKDVVTKGLLEECVQMACWTDEELDKHFDEAIEQLLMEFIAMKKKKDNVSEKKPIKINTINLLDL